LRENHNRLSKVIEKTFYELVAIKSDTNTILEKDVESYLYNWLSNIEYFQMNTENYGRYKIQKDSLERSIVWALLKGKGEKTLILLHHHDVVDAYDFGGLLKYAYSPMELQKEMSNIEINEEAREDLFSEQWIFGRGTADMKAGAAIQLAIIENYSKFKNFQGNLLLLSVPDEESLSVGMRGSIPLLEELKNKFNLKYTLCVNSEPHQRQEKDTGIVHEGSVGKLMPLVYIRGKKTHVGDIFQGFNPIFLQAEIMKRTELNENLADIAHNEMTPPPAWINFRDRKEAYDASIPLSSGGYFTLLTLKRTPKEVINELKNICEAAFEEVIKDMNEHYSNYLKRINKIGGTLPWKTKVMTFEEIFNEAVSNGREDFLRDYENTVNRVKDEIECGKINMPESNFLLIEKVLEYNDLSPKVVIAFSPPYYPHISNRDFNNVDMKVADLSKEINTFTSKQWGEKYTKQEYFMGISDMSYMAIKEEEKIIDCIESNMPLWEKVYYIPFENMKNISMPAINIGPWGKDLHKITERVYSKDLFERTPDIIQHVIEYILT